MYCIIAKRMVLWWKRHSREEMSSIHRPSYLSLCPFSSPSLIPLPTIEHLQTPAFTLASQDHIMASINTTTTTNSMASTQASQDHTMALINTTTATGINSMASIPDYAACSKVRPPTPSSNLEALTDLSTSPRSSS